MGYEEAAKVVGWGIQSMRRYLKRVGKDEPPIKKRGAKARVIRMEDIESLRGELARLPHGAKRTRGVGELRRKYRSRIPRRMFRNLVVQARKEYRRQVDESWTHVLWNCPGLAWSMDIVEYAFNGRKFFILQTMDMTTKYKFEPLVGNAMFNGEEVAGHTARLYATHGAPLFQKRDNGGNLNDATMREILADGCVVPLNSPAYYPRYNGSMENAQCELRNELDRLIDEESITTDEGFVGAIHRATNNLNHKRRVILGGETSCFNYSRNGRVQYQKQQRTEVYTWIKNLALDIEQDATYNDRDLWFRKAWRVAVETWLLKNGFITVVTPQEVLPISA